MLSREQSTDLMEAIEVDDADNDQDNDFHFVNNAEMDFEQNWQVLNCTTSDLELYFTQKDSHTPLEGNSNNIRNYGMEELGNYSKDISSQESSKDVDKESYDKWKCKICGKYFQIRMHVKRGGTLEELKLKPLKGPNRWRCETCLDLFDCRVTYLRKQQTTKPEIPEAKLEIENPHRVGPKDKDYCYK